MCIHERGYFHLNDNLNIVFTCHFFISKLLKSITVFSRYHNNPAICYMKWISSCIFVSQFPDKNNSVSSVLSCIDCSVRTACDIISPKTATTVMMTSRQRHQRPRIQDVRYIIKTLFRTRPSRYAYRGEQRARVSMCFTQTHLNTADPV